MAGDIEALGALTTAGLAASALDGPAGLASVKAVAPDAPPTHRHGDLAHGACANCGTVLAGDFCHACGQGAHVHRSIGHIFEEFLHGIWHFDSRAWRTLPRLAFQPGRLTRDYVYGKRAGYIAPLALFLFSVFLMFFVFEISGGPDLNRTFDSDSQMADARANVAEARGEVTDAANDVAEARRDSDALPVAAKALDTALATQRASLAAAEAQLAQVEAQSKSSAAAPAPKKSWQDRLAERARSGDIKGYSKIPWVDTNITNALKNPDFALYRIQQKAYKLSFLLIPLSLPTLWLMFCWRRDVHTYDHVVFALYSLSFMSLLLILVVLASKFSAYVAILGSAPGLALFVPPIHMFAQLKGAYRLSVAGALWRTVVLSIASVTTLAIFATIIVVVGLAD